MNPLRTSHTLFLWLLLALAVPLTEPARAAAGERGVIAVEQALLDLTTIGRVMNLAAHPDDEDGGTLALCRHGRGLSAFAVFANRGEGGQNEIGTELYRELGAIREVETLRATAREGAEAYFLGLEDYGYSKTADEAFQRWGEDRVVERIVYALRRLRPDVVFTNHDPVSGHGQHRAVAIGARKAFDLAADPAAYPEHFAAGLAPFAPALYLERLYGENATPEALAKLPPHELVRLSVEERDPLRGTTFRQQAHEALKEHESQGRWERIGPAERVFRAILRRPELLPLGAFPFDPDALTRVRVQRAAGELHAAEVSALLAPGLWRPRFPPPRERDALVDMLVAHRERLRNLLAPRERPARTALARELAERADRADDALAELLGVEPIRAMTDGSMRGIAAGIFTEPLFASNAYDAFAPGERLGAPERVATEVAGVRLTVPVLHDMPQRPPITCDFAPRRRVLLAPGAGARLEVRTLAVLNFAVPHDAFGLALVPEDETEAVWTGIIGAGPADEVLVPIRFELAAGAKTTRRFQLQTKEPQGLVAVSPFAVTEVDVAIRPGLRAGVVHSYDDTLENALADLGVAVRRLSADDLAFRDLDDLDAVLIDIRSYLVRDDLARFNSRLLEYAAAGGTVAVFYQKTAEWNPAENGGRAYAPYPLELSARRVVDETAPVTLLAPDHPLLARPNRLGAADFDGWIHERGLYFPKDTHAEEYRRLLACADAGEAALETGLLAARVGSGWYVYTSYAWYRQWLAGVPGAYRFLANLMELSSVEEMR